MLKVLPQARPPSPVLGKALAKQLDPTVEAAWRALLVLLEQPALSPRPRMSSVFIAQSAHGRSPILLMPISLSELSE
ncbi:hypothetical protein D3C80_1833500 [compost metagenome]